MSRHSEQAVLASLSEAEPMPTHEVMRRSGYATKETQRALRTLHEAGQIERVGQGLRPMYWRRLPIPPIDRFLGMPAGSSNDKNRRDQA